MAGRVGQGRQSATKCRVFFLVENFFFIEFHFSNCERLRLLVGFALQMSERLVPLTQMAQMAKVRLKVFEPQINMLPSELSQHSAILMMMMIPFRRRFGVALVVCRR